MRFTLGELREFLASDADVRILIVEGRDDVSVWHYIVPAMERINCVVYSVNEIDVPIDFGGNREAAMQLARTSSSWPESARIRFFLDADNDRHLGVPVPENVIFTDYRDLESYALMEPVFRHLCMTGARKSEREWQAARSVSTILLRPVGLLRIASARNKLNLPFQAAFIEGTLKRFFKKKGAESNLMMDNLCHSLINMTKRTHGDKKIIDDSLKIEQDNFKGIGDCEIIHGKDFIAFLAWHFKVGLDIASGLVDLAIGARIVEVRQAPNISVTRQWLLAA